MTRFLPLAALLVACGPKDDGPDGFTGSHTGSTTEGACVEVENRVLTIDEEVGDPLFFSGQNVLDEITGVNNTVNVLEYPDGLTIDVDVEFVYNGGEVRYIERDNEGILTQDQLATCFTAIEIEGDFTFVSGDGVFDEAFSGILAGKARRDGVFMVDLDGSSLGGTWTPEDSDIDSSTLGAGYVLEFDGQITNIGSEGRITLIDGETEMEAGLWAPPPTQGR